MRKGKNILLLGAAMLLCFTGCAKGRSVSPKVSERGVFAMDTYMTFKAYGDTSEAAVLSAEERIRELESYFSATLGSSDISRINSSAGNACEVSPDTAALIEKSLEMSRRTEGSLDITLYPVVRAWGFTAEEYRIPSADELAGLMKTVGWENVALSGNSVTVPEGCMLDLGALAKGYTSDSLMEIFRENGVDSAIVSLGGNVQTLGKKPDGSLWKVAVRDPASPETDICVVSVEDSAVVTSGNYERFFIGSDGKRYCHIIDPKSGFPVQNGLASVTVIGKSGTECDALSTALFVMGKDSALEYWRKNSGFELILVTEDGDICFTEGLSGRLELIGNAKAEVIGRA